MGLRVRDVMTREVLAVAPETNLRTAALLFADRHITGAPVVDAGGKPVGVVTQTDLVDPDRERSARRGTSLYYLISDEAQALSGRDAVGADGVVADVMSPLPLVIAPEASISQAIEAMVANDVHRLLVVHEERLIGIVTSTDLMRALEREEKPMTGLDVFDKTLQKSTAWILEVMQELGTTDRHAAYRALRGVLHVLRDRLSAEEVAELGAQMPMLIRGLYYEGWHPSQKRLRVRSRADFISEVSERMKPTTIEQAAKAVTAVLLVLERHISEGEIEDVKHALSRKLQDMWPGA